MATRAPKPLLSPPVEPWPQLLPPLAPLLAPSHTPEATVVVPSSSSRPSSSPSRGRTSKRTAAIGFVRIGHHLKPTWLVRSPSPSSSSCTSPAADVDSHRFGPPPASSSAHPSSLWWIPGARCHPVDYYYTERVYYYVETADDQE
ncbi:uncharacterized protein LOC125553824 [Triticum urartu]|uniref:uncharacterized protein LOC125553824 n=1 Tax=Triticum urartu TaxID=4572 RepID=UPI002042E705|nr:uncharacterized protein LOC125553824 [Triticum urartu]